jgi:3-hydroxy-9,10-secoandrosta-1,3,5(10)-triene-9,17-dione monooxygenase reductase component
MTARLQRTGVHPAPTIGADRLRSVLSHLPTSVCVVSTAVDGQPIGATVGSFTSVSLDPPLVAFFLTRASTTLAAIRDSGSFAVNVLADDQTELCSAFARKDAERSSCATWALGRDGAPRLEGSLAVVDCDVETVTPAGDHDMILGRVVDLHVQRDQTEPLVFWRGGLRALSPENRTQPEPERAAG